MIQKVFKVTVLLTSENDEIDLDEAFNDWIDKSEYVDDDGNQEVDLHISYLGETV